MMSTEGAWALLILATVTIMTFSRLAWCVRATNKTEAVMYSVAGGVSALLMFFVPPFNNLAVTLFTTIWAVYTFLAWIGPRPIVQEPGKSGARPQ